nr:pyocin activator PrtN family protein [Pseudomonas sp. 51_B]
MLQNSSSSWLHHHARAQAVNTAFILMAQYNGLAIIPIDQVCADYFTHLTPDMFQRKVLAGQIKLPITRLETSQKSARGIHIADLAQYLDQQREAALKECAQLNRTLRAG